MFVTQLCLTLWNPMDCSTSGSSVHGYIHLRMLERIALLFSRVSSWSRDWTLVFCIAGRFFTIWITRESSKVTFTSVQFSSVAQSCRTLCDPMNHSTPGLPVHHHLPEFTQTHVHWARDANQPSHPRSSPTPLAPNPSQSESFQWVNTSHEVAKVLEFQL